MKDKTSFRLISIGFFSGIVFSGIVFITINTFLNYQRQNSISKFSSASTVKLIHESTIQSNDKIDINQATLIDLVNLPGIGEAKAKAIIDFREKYGAFEEISELSYVPGIGNILLLSIQHLVIIN